MENSSSVGGASNQPDRVDLAEDLEEAQELGSGAGSNHGVSSHRGSQGEREHYSPYEEGGGFHDNVVAIERNPKKNKNAVRKKKPLEKNKESHDYRANPTECSSVTPLMSRGMEQTATTGASVSVQLPVSARGQSGRKIVTAIVTTAASTTLPLTTAEAKMAMATIAMTTAMTTTTAITTMLRTTTKTTPLTKTALTTTLETSATEAVTETTTGFATPIPTKTTPIAHVTTKRSIITTQTSATTTPIATASTKTTTKATTTKTTPIPIPTKATPAETAAALTRTAPKATAAASTTIITIATAATTTKTTPIATTTKTTPLATAGTKTTPISATIAKTTSIATTTATSKTAPLATAATKTTPISVTTTKAIATVKNKSATIATAALTTKTTTVTKTAPIATAATTTKTTPIATTVAKTSPIVSAETKQGSSNITSYQESNVNCTDQIKDQLDNQPLPSVLSLEDTSGGQLHGNHCTAADLASWDDAFPDSNFPSSHSLMKTRSVPQLSKRNKNANVSVKKNVFKSALKRDLTTTESTVLGKTKTLSGADSQMDGADKRQTSPADSSRMREEKTPSAEKTKRERQNIKTFVRTYRDDSLMQHLEDLASYHDSTSSQLGQLMGSSEDEGILKWMLKNEDDQHGLQPFDVEGRLCQSHSGSAGQGHSLSVGQGQTPQQMSVDVETQGMCDRQEWKTRPHTVLRAKNTSCFLKAETVSEDDWSTTETTETESGSTEGSLCDNTGQSTTGLTANMPKQPMRGKQPVDQPTTGSSTSKRPRRTRRTPPPVVYYYDQDDEVFTIPVAPRSTPPAAPDDLFSCSNLNRPKFPTIVKHIVDQPTTGSSTSKRPWRTTRTLPPMVYYNDQDGESQVDTIPVAISSTPDASEMAEDADRQDQMSRDSRILFDICCHEGFTEEQWDRRIKMNDASNTSYSYRGMLSSNVRVKALYSGSASEGVAMDFLGSDTDIMIVLSGTHVIEDDDISPDESDNVFQMSSTNHPAFVNTELQHRGETEDIGIVDTPNCCEPTTEGRLLLNGEQLKALFSKPGMTQYAFVNTELRHLGETADLNIAETQDRCELTTEGRLFLNGEQLKVPFFKPGFTLYGPAQTATAVSTDFDFVISLHCRSWPSVSREWIDRPREYNWPTPEQIKKIVDNGCELVSVGAPNSASPQFDFRLSSSLAEKILVRSFNIYQIQCYFLLKVILKFRIKPCFSIETLCSYHMKTIMLYVVETTNPVVWREDNLVHCFMICLQKLQSFLRDGHCPQYFIPQQNLFEQKVKPQLEKVMERVNVIVAEGWGCVLRSTPLLIVTPEDCEEIEPRYPINRWKWEEENTLAYSHMYALSIGIGSDTMSDGSLQSSIDRLQHMCSHDVENESKYFPCKDTVLIIRSLLKSTIGLYLLNEVTRQDRDHVELPVLQEAEQCMNSACDSSIVSCKLKYALFLYVIKETERCVDLVMEYVTAHINRVVVPICCLDSDRMTGPASNPCYHKLKSDITFTLHDVRDAYTRLIPPVYLFKWEVKACPLIIQNVAETRQLVTEDDRKYPSVLMIDPLVFACLLRVLASTDLCRYAESRESLKMLQKCADFPDQCFIFYPDIARLVLEECRQYVSSGSQQDVPPSK